MLSFYKGVGFALKSNKMPPDRKGARLLERVPLSRQVLVYLGAKSSI